MLDFLKDSDKKFLQNNYDYLAVLAAILLLVVLVLVIVMIIKGACHRKKVRRLEQKNQALIMAAEPGRLESKPAEIKPSSASKAVKSADSEAKDENDAVIIDGEEAAGENDEKSERAMYLVKFDRPQNNWVILKKGQERATRRVATKEEAVKIAKELSKKHDASLSIRKKDGKFQKQR